MSNASEPRLSTVPDDIIDAISGGEMNDDEREWFLNWAAKYKQKGYTPEYTADMFLNMTFGANRHDITTKEVNDLLAAEWDNL